MTRASMQNELVRTRKEGEKGGEKEREKDSAKERQKETEKEIGKENRQTMADQSVNQGESTLDSLSTPVATSTPAVVTEAKGRPVRRRSARTKTPSVTPRHSNTTSHVVTPSNTTIDANPTGDTPKRGPPLRLTVGNKTMFQCDRCEFISLHRKTVADHIRVHIEKPFQCDMCRKRFADKHLLDLHRTIHINRCSKCYQVFSADTLQEHQQNCTKKHYECYVCKYKTPRGSHLKKHMNRVHFGASSSKHSCEHCHSKFSSKFEMYRHALRAHELLV